MRVLILAPFLGRTGAPIVLLRLVRALARRHAIDILRAESPEGPLADDFRETGARIVAPAGLRRRYDVALAVTIAAARALLTVGARVPTVWWIHEAEMGRSWIQGLPSARHAFGAAVHLVFAATHQPAMYAPWLGDRPWTIVPYGLAIDRSPRPSPFPEPRGFRILQVGSVAWHKGQDLTLSALGRIPDPALQAYFVGGDGPGRYRAAIDDGLRRSPALAVRTHFLGEHPPESVPAFVQHADILVMPSRDEVFPQAVIEAMGHGLPVIASGLRTIREVLTDGVNGLLVPSDDAAALALAIRRLHAAPHLRLQLSAEARRTVAARFDLDRHVAAMEAILAEAAGTERVGTGSAA